MNQPAKARRNWWKPAFFVVLIAFEIARESAVVSAAAGPVPNTFARIYSSDGFVTAEGTWKRIDGGGELVPSTVSIECRQQTGQCLEATTSIYDDHVFPPDLSYSRATFAEDSVSYVNDFPSCATYSVRIDLRMKKAFAVREKKANVSNPDCSRLEERIEMQLANGRDIKKDPLNGHFVPIFRLLSAIF